MSFYDAIILGAGAAGFMAAIEAAKAGKKVALINSNNKIGEKIRISGGGRCNFTNLGAAAENYISNNPHFCKSALAQYGPQDFIKLVEKHRIEFFEKKLGQLFCEESSQLIIDMLFKEADANKVEIIAPVLIDKILLEDSAQTRFRLIASDGEIFTANSLIIATGGLSIPQTGASDFGYRLARQFDLNVVEPRAGLVPLVVDPASLKLRRTSNSMELLAGTSFDALVSSGKTKFRENILFTHNGLSGPAILQISNYLQNHSGFEINLCPDLDLKNYLIEVKQSGEKRKLKNILKEIKFAEDHQSQLKTKIQRENIFPEKFVDLLADEIDLEKTMAEVSNKVFDELVTKLQKWRVKPSDDEGYAKAEVTLGGIDTKELDSKTMECKKISGLYFIGEVVDVTGWLGGYNFQWAWASGYLAGNAC